MTSNELLKIIIDAARDCWQTLELSQQYIAELPPEIGMLSSLQELNLGENQLTALPHEIGNLVSLQRLCLQGNQLTELPSEIGNLTNLKDLDLERNNFAEFPLVVSTLQLLEKLGLGHNEYLSSIPPEICKLDRLEYITLDHNSLVDLPSEIGQLSKLKHLDLHHNRLALLPPEIGKLASLQELHLLDNQLTALPSEARYLSNLRQLSLHGNPISQMPPEIVAKRNEPFTILNYYYQLIEGPQRPLNEAKMILVGEPAVGKTSLVKRLIYDTHNPEEDTTKGIYIDEWRLQIHEENVRVNVWDFGGQEIMHATHQFFLTKRALYLMVLSCRQDEVQNRIEYWLKIIQSFGGDSPVIVVGNKCDQGDLDIDEHGLRKKYPSIKAICRTSCPDEPQGMDHLTEAINKEIGAIPHVHDAFRASWFAVKDRLERMDQSYITYRQYVKLCREEDVTSVESQNTLIGFLNDLGVALHYGHHPLLEDRNVLKPEWVTKGVYSILIADELKKNNGKLHWNMLPNLLPASEYPSDTYRFILGMMAKFELCFELEGTNFTGFLVPDALPKTEVDTGEWTDVLRFEYEYDVLPQSVIPRFMVRMHPYVGTDRCWRTGVLLANNSNEALVKADQEERTIRIAVRGQSTTRRDFLSHIRGTLDSIHANIAAIQVKSKVPIPGYTGASLDMDFALKLEGRGRTDYALPGRDGEIIEIDLQKVLGLIIPEEARRNPEMVQIRALLEQVLEELRLSSLRQFDSMQATMTRLDEILSDHRVTQLGINEIYEIAAAMKAKEPARFEDIRQRLENLGSNVIGGVVANKISKTIIDAFAS
jgi:internalin A